MDDPFAGPPLGARALPRKASRPDLSHALPPPPLQTSASSSSLRQQYNDSAPPPPSLRNQLQSLLDEKTNQLQMAGMMGQRILEQQTELETRIKELEEAEADDDGDDREDRLRLKLEELEHAMVNWEKENEEHVRRLGPKVSYLKIQSKLTGRIRIRLPFLQLQPRR